MYWYSSSLNYQLRSSWESLKCSFTCPGKAGKRSSGFWSPKMKPGGNLWNVTWHVPVKPRQSEIVNAGWMVYIYLATEIKYHLVFTDAVNVMYVLLQKLFSTHTTTSNTWYVLTEESFDSQYDSFTSCRNVHHTGILFCM